jgi:hypothetical protein
VQGPDGGEVLIPLVDELISLEDGTLRVVDGLLPDTEG